MKLRGKVYYHRMRVNGKPTWIRLDTDKAMSLKMLSEKTREGDAEKFGRPVQNCTWEAFKSIFHRDHSRGLAPASHLKNIAVLRKFDEDNNVTHLSQVNPQLLCGWRVKMQSQGLAIASINRYLGVLRSVMSKAVEWDFVSKFDSKKAAGLVEPDHEITFFTVNETEKLIWTANSILARRGALKPGDVVDPEEFNIGRYDWATMILIGVRAGLRREEIRRLTWDDIKWETNTIRVADKAGARTKGKRSRHVPLADDLRAHLESMKRNGQTVIDPLPSLGVMTTFIRRICRKAGLVGSPQKLRRTFGSHLVQAGVPIYDVSKLLGHANVATTIKSYAGLAPSTLQNAVDKLPNLGQMFGTQLGTHITQSDANGLKPNKGDFTSENGIIH